LSIDIGLYEKQTIFQAGFIVNIGFQPRPLLRKMKISFVYSQCCNKFTPQIGSSGNARCNGWYFIKPRIFIKEKQRV
jgi:hypothetical protein